jgi:hypothetical protein
MNGYVKNKSVTWMHAMKRSIGPGTTVSLDELYEQYGTKHDLATGEEFAHWLRCVKLPNRDVWDIVFNEDSQESTEIKEEPKVEQKAPITELAEEDPTKNTTIQEIRKMTVKDVVNLSVRKARDVVPNIMDSHLLRYALQEANPLTGKDSLCRILRKRIQELELSRL